VGLAALIGGCDFSTGVLTVIRDVGVTLLFLLLLLLLLVLAITLIVLVGHYHILSAGDDGRARGGLGFERLLLLACLLPPWVVGAFVRAQR